MGRKSLVLNDLGHGFFKKLTSFVWNTPPPPRAGGSDLYDWDFQIIGRDWSASRVAMLFAPFPL